MITLFQHTFLVHTLLSRLFHNWTDLLTDKLFIGDYQLMLITS